MDRHCVSLQILKPAVQQAVQTPSPAEIIMGTVRIRYPFFFSKQNVCTFTLKCVCHGYSCTV